MTKIPTTRIFNYLLIVAFIAISAEVKIVMASMEEALNAVDRKDYFTAYQEFKLLAEQGDKEAQFNLAMLFKQGSGIMKDSAKAAVWFRKSADQGLPDAQYYLGSLYDAGEGVEKKPEYAFQWYRKAAEQGNAFAQTNLGVMYAKGEGVTQDLILGYVWLNLAAAQGIGAALDNREAVAESMSEEMLGKVREISRQYFQRYVEPFLANTPNLRRGAYSRHLHPDEKEAQPGQR